MAGSVANAGAGFRGLSHAIAVRKSEPASIEPSRNMVFQEMVSPGPKQPQLISSPLNAARTIRVKNTSSRADVTQGHGVEASKLLIGLRPVFRLRCATLNTNGIGEWRLELLVDLYRL